MCVCVFSHVWLFVTLWTVACQAPLSMGFSKQEYWSGLPFPPPRESSWPRHRSTSPVSPALAGRFFTTEPPGKPITDRSPMIIIYLWDNRVCFDGFGVVFNKGDTQEKMFCLLKLMLVTFSAYENSLHKDPFPGTNYHYWLGNVIHYLFICSVSIPLGC